MGWVERESTSEEESKARLESREAGIRKNEWANLKKKKKHTRHRKKGNDESRTCDPLKQVKSNQLSC